MKRTHLGAGCWACVPELADAGELRPQARRALDLAGRAEDLPGRLPRDLTGAAIYLDPPYRGCTGYGWDVERAALLAMADDYARRGARVVISESSSLVGELGAGWSAVDVTIGRKAEWLTRWGCAPVRRVHSQLRLFSCTETTT